jgi:hypothetical protein
VIRVGRRMDADAARENPACYTRLFGFPDFLHADTVPGLVYLYGIQHAGLWLKQHEEFVTIISNLRVPRADLSQGYRN